MSSQPYMSPEQATGRPVDARSDVFSLGLIFYELAAGRHPFPGDSALEVAAAIVRDKPAPASSFNPKIKPALERILTTCLAKAPRDRYSTARDSAARSSGSRRLHGPIARVRGSPFLTTERLHRRGPRDGPRRARQPGLVVEAREREPAATRAPASGERPTSGSQVGEPRSGAALLRSATGRPRWTEQGRRGRLQTGGRARSRSGAGPPPSRAAGLDRRDGSREYFRRAVAHREALDERDKGWLHAWEPVMQREPADQVETIRRLRALVRRFPARPKSPPIWRILTSAAPRTSHPSRGSPRPRRRVSAPPAWPE